MAVVKSPFAAVAAAVLAVMPSVGRCATIHVDQVRQRYPWNGIVDIDYTITYADGEKPFDAASDRLEVMVVNKAVSPATTNTAYTFAETPSIEAGKHRISWNANADGCDFVSRNVTVRLSVVRYAAKYMVVDVSKGPNASSYPVTYLDGAPVGGFNTSEYKTGKIVLRIIPSGAYVAGSPTTEPGREQVAGAEEPKTEVQHRVVLTKPFYIGIFEVTQQQWLNVMGGSNPSSAKVLEGPVDNMNWMTIRGDSNWPGSHQVGGNSFFNRLRLKTGVEGFDLPTEFQWEYACRAGTTTPFNNNVPCATLDDITTQATVLGNWGGSAMVPSGGYPPNAWGLYDMHGNVWEWCLDYHMFDVSSLKQVVDPVGPPSGEGGLRRVRRGGGYIDKKVGKENAATRCRSANRNRATETATTGQEGFGFRLACAVPWQEAK